MKKTIMIVALMLFTLSATSFSQVKFGLKAGVNVANLTMDMGGVSLSPDSKVGAVAGAFVNVRLTDKFGIQPELLYSMKGSKFSDSDFGEAITKLNYLSVPVMAKYYFGGFNLQAGPMFDFLLSAKDEYDGEEEDTKDEVKGMDLGLGLGLGYELPLGISFDARYMMGLTDINDVSEMESVEIKNKGFQITVGLAF
jgi:hypothetical protein